MRQRLLLGGLGLFFVLCSTLLVLLPNIPVSAHTSHVSTVLETPTATPNANDILNQAATSVATANQAAMQADREAATTQGIIGLISFMITVFSAIIALIFGLGIWNNVRFSNLNKELKGKLAGVERQESEILETRRALVYLNLGDRLMGQKEYDQAFKIYKKVETLLPADVEINYILGRIYASMKYYEDAVKALSMAISLDPKFVEAYVELGLAYRRRGDTHTGQGAEALRQADYEEAKKTLLKALVHRGDNEEALRILGGLYRRMGKIEDAAGHQGKAVEYYTQALEYYKQAVNVDHNSSYALNNVASLLWYLDQLREARKYFRRTEAIAEGRIEAAHTPDTLWDYYDLSLAQLVLASENKDAAKKQEAMKNFAIAIQLSSSVQFDSALDNLNLLQKAREPIAGLDDMVGQLKHAQANAR